MMKMSGRVTGCCGALLLILTSVSAGHKELNSIRHLKEVNFGRSVPKHSLLLLHWFANEVSIDNNDVIRLTFDPNNGVYGSHHYGNFEGLLDPLPQGYTYYTVGNINQETDVPFPSYVLNPQRGYEGRNMDRIIIRVQNGPGLQRIDQVFITQHYETWENQGTRYDPDRTYQITTNLLRQIREFSLRDSHIPLLYLRYRFGSNVDVSHIRNTWGSLACLGLLLYIVIEEKDSSNQHNRRPENNNNNRPGHGSRRLGSNNTPGLGRRWESNDRSYINNQPENNHTLEYRQFHCNRRHVVICGILLALILLALIIFLCVYLTRP